MQHEHSPKYPRTFHAPWSSGTNDDKVQHDVGGLFNVSLIVTEKLDGSNVTLERNSCYARTHSGPPTHPSFDAFKQLHATVKHKIPEMYQICGEWLYAKHSIHYTSLPNYLMIFGVRDLKNMMWLDWNWVEEWANELGVPTVPVLERTDVENEKELRELCERHMRELSACGGEREGVVIRTAHGYHSDSFSQFALKIVRENHVQTNTHWRNQEIVRNLLAKE